MTKTIPYSLYKKNYSELPTENYSKEKKTIDIILPDGYSRPRFPSEWERFGNSYKTPNGCRVYFWASGLAEHFRVEHYVSHSSKTFPPSLYVREQVMQYVLDKK